jgi:hypothetical protein
MRDLRDWSLSTDENERKLALVQAAIDDIGLDCDLAEADAEAERVLALTDAEVRAEAFAQGRDLHADAERLRAACVRAAAEVEWKPGDRVLWGEGAGAAATLLGLARDEDTGDVLFCDSDECPDGGSGPVALWRIRFDGGREKPRCCERAIRGRAPGNGEAA